VNHGRWVVDCPGCTTGWIVNYDSPLALFDAVGGIHRRCTCGYELAIQFPAEYAAINSALGERKRMVNRNWYPHETVIDLLAQTLEREEP
jgi:hypothetical protein